MGSYKIFLGLFGFCALSVSMGAALAATAGHAQFINGNVQITDSGGRVRALQKGDAVNEGDMITSAKAASAQIRMQDGGFVAVRPETQLKFDQFNFKGKEDGSERGFFSLLKGGFRAVTGLIGRTNKENYRVTTPAATIGIRGTDHESFYAPVNLPGALAGAYSKVNVGETSLTTNVGTVYVKPNQMGYAGGLNQPPKLQPVNTNIFTVAPAPAKEVKKEEQKTAGGENGKGETQKAVGTSGEAEEVRSSAVVDNTGTAEAGVATAAPTTGGAVTDEVVIVLPTEEVVPIELVDLTTGTFYNATDQTITSGSGQTTSIQNGTYDVLAQAAADAAVAAWSAAQAVAALAAQADTALAGVAQVNTAPASTAISSANSAISTTSPLVTSATALALADATAAANNVASAQAMAATVASQALAAQTAIASNGIFSDSSAVAANNLINTPTTGAAALVQSAKVNVEAAASTVTAQNTALANAKTAASSALNGANTSVTTANGLLTTASSQNTAIVTAQTSAAGLVAQAQAAEAAALTAKDAAQAAAALAASLQAAGDFNGAAAQLVVAQDQQTIAQQQQAIAESAKATLANQLAAAQAAQTAAGTAVTTATNAATTAATDAATASTQAAAAQTASTNASAALTTSTTNLATVTTNAPVVATNALIAAYNNPAVVTANRFIGGLKTVVAPTVGQYVEGGGPGAAFTGAGTANTSFVLDGTGNLVESRHTWYEESPASTATTQLLVADANVKRTGGVAAETFKLPDNSIYGGRWTGGSITVTDNATVVPTFTRSFGATSEHWAIMLAPPTGYVQALTGTTAYTMAAGGATSPTDALGNVGVLNTATLSANFTSQLVSAALNLTIIGKTLDVQAPNMPINGMGFSSAGAINPTCTGCGASTYYAHVGGLFAGDAAASAGLSYSLWTGAAPGATTPATDLIQGLAAFNTATAPTVSVGGPFAAYVPNYTLLEFASPFMGGWNNMLLPGNITYTGGGLSSFSAPPMIAGDGGTNSTTVIGGASPVTANATSFVTTDIKFGRWTSVTDVQNTWTTPLGMANGDMLTTWMYGSEGYLDPGITIGPSGQMYGTFTYALDGSTVPLDRQSGQKGTLTSASVTANFVAQTVSANIALSVGGQAWSAGAANVAFSGNQFFASSTPGGGAGNNLTINMDATTGTTPCPTCFGSLDGAFTGQNFAGAMMSYNLWDNANAGGGDISGEVAFARTGAAVTNGTPAPTGYYFVSGNKSGGGSIERVDTLNNPVGSGLDTPGGVLTAYSSGDPAVPANGYYSVAVNCVSCNSAATTNAANPAAPTGVYFGTWDVGTHTSTWGGSMGSASPHWITGPEAGPLFLPNALLGTKTFISDGGMVTNMNGVAGTVLGSTALTVDFTKQVVGINLDLLINDALGSPHTWNAKTLPGNEAIINSSDGMGGVSFWASSGNGSGANKLTVTVDGTTSGGGNVSGQLTGAGLNGAILSYDLWASFAVPPYFEQVNGVAALVGAISDVATPHRGVLVSLADTSITKSSMLGFYANNPTRMVTDGGGNLTQFDMNMINSHSSDNPSFTVTNSTSTLTNAGNDPLTGISWGRWAGGTVNSTDRDTGVTTPHTLAGSLHWIAGSTETAAVTLPVSGTFTYTNAGGTSPTDNLGTVGTLNSATLSANFTAQTVSVGVNATVGTSNMTASASNVPIIQKTAFYADSRMPLASPAHLAVTCSGGCGASHEGTIIGGFGGIGATGATMAYGLEKIGGASPGVISGVVGFRR